MCILAYSSSEIAPLSLILAPQYRNKSFGVASKLADRATFGSNTD